MPKEEKGARDKKYRVGNLLKTAFKPKQAVHQADQKFKTIALKRSNLHRNMSFMSLSFRQSHCHDLQMASVKKAFSL